MSRYKLCWKQWADHLRQTMMTELRPEVTKTVEEIKQESETDKSLSVLQTQRFWNSCRDGQAANDSIVKAGLLIQYEPNAAGKVEAVTFRLNGTWQSILQNAVERRERQLASTRKHD